MYNLAKAATDSLLRWISRSLPAWQRYTVEKTLPARLPYQPAVPVNIALLPIEDRQRFVETLRFPEHRVYCLRNVHVTWDGGIFHNLRVFVPSIVHPRFASRFQDTLLLRQWVGEKVDLPEPCVAVCHDQWSVNNYYHWLVDTLPRLLVLRQMHPNVLLLLPQHWPRTEPRDYIGRSVAALGFTNYQMLHARQILRAECVIVPELTAPSLTQNPELIRKVRAQLLAAFNPTPPVATRRVYAARDSDGVRHVVNEQDMDALLESFGFEKIYFDRLSFLEQIQLMGETTLFMGIHGAAMTNMLFLSSQAKVIELLNKDCGELCYTRLASCLNLPYFFVPCTPTAPALGNQSPMVSDVAEVASVIALAIEC